MNPQKPKTMAKKKSKKSVARAKRVKAVPFSKKVTYEEKIQVIPLIVRRIKLANKQGITITNDHLRHSLAKHYGVTMVAGTMRKLLHYIRINGIVPCLIANSGGYYIAKTTLEMTTYLASLQKRIREIGVLKRALDSQGHTKLGNQLKTSPKKRKFTRKTLKKR